jgi:AraC-like DNA-binding protein
VTRDRLSEVLDLVQVRGVMSGGSVLRGHWRTHSVIDDDLKFIALVQGRARLSADGLETPVDLAAGDVVVLNRRTWLTLEGGDGPGAPVVVDPPAPGSVLDLRDAAAPGADIVIGGRIELDPIGRDLLLHALPAVAHVGATNAVGPRLRGHVHRLFSEITTEQVGADFAIRQYGQLLVLDVIRGFLQEDAVPPGWLRVLGDERLRPALERIHREPARNWSLTELARTASMSRSAFAERFRDVAGSPPLAYLITWRMLLAQRALRTRDASIGTLAVELGYSSESAFSSAFKRRLGESPSAFRRRARVRDQDRPGARSGDERRAREAELHHEHE